MKMRPPAPGGSLNHAGITYSTDEHDEVEIPDPVIPTAISHGYTPAPERKAEPEPATKVARPTMTKEAGDTPPEDKSPEKVAAAMDKDTATKYLKSHGVELVGRLSLAQLRKMVFDHLSSHPAP